MAVVAKVPNIIPTNERLYKITEVAAGDQIDLVSILGRPSHGLRFLLTDSADVVTFRLNNKRTLRSSDYFNSGSVDVWSKAGSFPLLTATGSAVFDISYDTKVSSIEIESVSLSTGTTIEILTLGSTQEGAIGATSAPIVLAARWWGGQQLESDGSILPIDANYFFENGSGTRLEVEEDVVEGGTLGFASVIDANGVVVDGTVVGLPSTERLNGFNAVDSTNYVSMQPFADADDNLTIEISNWSVTSLVGVGDTALAPTANGGILVDRDLSNVRVRFYSTTHTLLTTLTAAVSASTVYNLFITTKNTGLNVAVNLYVVRQSDGVTVSSDSSSIAVLAWDPQGTGTYNLGIDGSLANPYTGTSGLQYAVWQDDILTQVECEDYVKQTGSPPADPDTEILGLQTGVYDPSSLNRLIYATGSATINVVEAQYSDYIGEVGLEGVSKVNRLDDYLETAVIPADIPATWGFVVSIDGSDFNALSTTNGVLGYGSTAPNRIRVGYVVATSPDRIRTNMSSLVDLAVSGAEFDSFGSHIWAFQYNGTNLIRQAYQNGVQIVGASVVQTSPAGAMSEVANFLADAGGIYSWSMFSGTYVGADIAKYGDGIWVPGAIAHEQGNLVTGLRIPFDINDGAVLGSDIAQTDGLSNTTYNVVIGTNGGRVYVEKPRPPVAPAGLGISQSTLNTSGGEYVIGTTSYNVATSGTLLFYGDITSIDSSASQAVIAGALGSSGSFRGVRLDAVNSTTLQGQTRRSTGTASPLQHTVADMTTYGPRLYWQSWDSTYGANDRRVGVDNMLVDADYTHTSIEPGTGASDVPPSVGGRAADTDSITYSGSWALLVDRILSADEWAAAAAGDWTWAVDDPSLNWIIAPRAGSTVAIGETLDPARNMVPTPNSGPLVLSAGSVAPTISEVS